MRLFIARILAYYSAEFSPAAQMSYFHLVFGLLLFVVFTITGRYMRLDFPEKHEMDQALRILMRSRHIYILLSSLIHMALGIYMTLRPHPAQRALQLTGSAALVLASLLLIYAFAVETYQLQGFSDYSRYGIYLSLAGVVLHLLGGLEIGRRNDRAH
jgi:hypothetical protein